MRRHVALHAAQVSLTKPLKILRMLCMPIFSPLHFAHVQYDICCTTCAKCSHVAWSGWIAYVIIVVGILIAAVLLPLRAAAVPILRRMPANHSYMYAQYTERGPPSSRHSTYTGPSSLLHS
jgi:hypothetical protein